MGDAAVLGAFEELVLLADELVTYGFISSVSITDMFTFCIWRNKFYISMAHYTFTPTCQKLTHFLLDESRNFHSMSRRLILF